MGSPQVQPGRVAGAPSGLEVVATDRAIEVEDFTGEVEAGLFAALHVLEVDLSECHSSGGDFGFGVAQGTLDRNRALLQRIDELQP